MVATASSILRIGFPTSPLYMWLTQAHGKMSRMKDLLIQRWFSGLHGVPSRPCFPEIGEI